MYSRVDWCPFGRRTVSFLTWRSTPSKTSTLSSVVSLKSPCSGSWLIVSLQRCLNGIQADGHQRLRNDAEEKHRTAVQAHEHFDVGRRGEQRFIFRRIEIHELDDSQVVKGAH